mmetsp:Transcript_25213/g.62246  ORF Transcript_25213/g.62246 Transcript_25213/m.62246 type:complete len:499 (-) Transcript_25213:39-1535(-)
MLRRGVGGEPVDGHHHGDPELHGVLDMAHQVAHPRLHQLHVLVGVRVVQGPARRHRRPPSVQLERPHRGHDHRAVRLQARGAALEVDELLQADVRPEPRLGDDEAALAHHGQRDLVRDDGRVARRDVGEGPGVHQHGGALHGLQQRGLQGVAHQRHQRAGDAEVVGGDGHALHVRRHHHVAQARLHVRQGRGHGQHSHDLRRHGDVEPRLARVPLLRGVLTHGDEAQEAVVHVHHAPPRDLVLVDVEARELALLLQGEVVRVRLGDAQLLEALEHHGGELALALLVLGAQAVEQRVVLLGRLVEHARVNGGGEQVVGHADGVDVAGEVQVHFLHGDDLAVAAPRRAPLDAEGGAHGRLPDARHAVLAEVRAHGLRQSDGGGGLALAQRRGVDAGHHHVVPHAAGAQLGHHLLGNLGLVVAVGLIVLLLQPARGGDGLDGMHGGCLRDVDVGGRGGDDARELADALVLGDVLAYGVAHGVERGAEEAGEGRRALCWDAA